VTLLKQHFSNVNVLLKYYHCSSALLFLMCHDAAASCI